MVPTVSPTAGVDEANKTWIVLSESPHRRNCSLNNLELLVVVNLYDNKDVLGKANA